MGPGGGNVWEIYFNPKRAKVGWVWVKPIAAIAQIVSGMRALVWTELATDHSKQARLTLRRDASLELYRENVALTPLEQNFHNAPVALHSLLSGQIVTNQANSTQRNGCENDPNAGPEE